MSRPPPQQPATIAPLRAIVSHWIQRNLRLPDSEFLVRRELELLCRLKYGSRDKGIRMAYHIQSIMVPTRRFMERMRYNLRWVDHGVEDSQGAIVSRDQPYLMHGS